MITWCPADCSNPEHTSTGHTVQRLIRELLRSDAGSDQ